MYHGYYYGFDTTYLLLVVPALLIALIAQIQVKSAFSRYARVRCTSGLTGAQAAQRILQANGITDVRIEHITGKLTDHFDPQAKVIRLSDEVYGVASIAAVGVAAHEAGHAVVIHQLPTQDPVHQITIVPRGEAGGMTIYLPDEDRSYLSRSYMLDRIAGLLGGRAAEQLVLGDISTGASNDIEQATKLARAMITRYGMSDDFGMVALETVTNQYLGGDASLACSADTQTKIDQQVVELVKREHDKAVDILTANREKLDRLAAFLYEKETITGEEFMHILGE